jgi:hypothetical protein
LQELAVVEETILYTRFLDELNTPKSETPHRPKILKYNNNIVSLVRRIARLSPTTVARAGFGGGNHTLHSNPDKS